jgi:hypothetical protein
MALGTDPTARDSDDDGLDDGAEVMTHRTDPLAPDTDEDGVGDGSEIAEGTNPHAAAAAGPAEPTMLFGMEFTTVLYAIIAILGALAAIFAVLYLRARP